MRRDKGLGRNKNLRFELSPWGVFFDVENGTFLSFHKTEAAAKKALEKYKKSYPNNQYIIRKNGEK